MGSLYDRAEIYDLIENEERFNVYRRHWERGLDVLARMDGLTGDGGWLYFDVRNWDRILRERKRFYLYHPFFDGETRVNLVQAWDYHPDGTMTFNLLYTFERDNRMVQQEVFEEHYFPIPRRLLLDGLTKLGYREIRLLTFPAAPGRRAEDAEWYCVLARKGSGGRCVGDRAG